MNSIDKTALLQAMIDETLEKQKTLRKYEINEFHPSSAGSCLRKSFYSRKYGQKHETSTLRIFKIGDIIHDFIQSNVLTNGVSEMALEMQYKIKDDILLLKGSCDHVDAQFVWELKSSSFAYKNKDQPMESHYMQLQLYLFMYNNSDAKDRFGRIEYGRIVYIDKKTMQTYEHTVHYDEKFAKSIIENRFYVLYKLLVANELPPRIDDTFKDWQCRNCAYKHLCKVNRT